MAKPQNTTRRKPVKRNQIFLGGISTEEGGTTSPLPPEFARMVDAYSDAMTRYHDGLVSLEDTARRLQGLRIVDDLGGEWTLGATSMKWFRRTNGMPWSAHSAPTMSFKPVTLPAELLDPSIVPPVSARKPFTQQHADTTEVDDTSLFMPPPDLESLNLVESLDMDDASVSGTADDLLPSYPLEPTEPWEPRTGLDPLTDIPPLPTDTTADRIAMTGNETWGSDTLSDNLSAGTWGSDTLSDNLSAGTWSDDHQGGLPHEAQWEAHDGTSDGPTADAGQPTTFDETFDDELQQLLDQVAHRPSNGLLDEPTTPGEGSLRPGASATTPQTPDRTAFDDLLDSTTTKPHTPQGRASFVDDSTEDLSFNLEELLSDEGGDVDAFGRPIVRNSGTDTGRSAPPAAGRAPEPHGDRQAHNRNDGPTTPQGPKASQGPTAPTPAVEPFGTDNWDDDATEADDDLMKRLLGDWP